jgi:lantibiotic modifying enzyme
MEGGPTVAPVASVNFGAAGIAYCLYRIAQRRDDGRLLAAADVWSGEAVALSTRDDAFCDPDSDITLDVVGEISLFHSMSGLPCVQALTSIARGDADRAVRSIEDFVSASRLPWENSDVTLGTAGLLLGCAELVEAVAAPWVVDTASVRKRGDEIADDILRVIEADDLEKSTDIPSLGIAHGWGGLLFALLRWAKATGRQPPSRVGEILEQLSSFAEPHVGGVRWPVHNPTRPSLFMEGWCNGTAGHVMLFALGHQVLKRDDLRSFAERGAISAWATNMELGTLCCGLAGTGYAMLAAHRCTQAEIWLERAHAVARRAAADLSGPLFVTPCTRARLVLRY